MLVDKRAERRRQQVPSKELEVMNHSIHHSLCHDRKAQVIAAGNAIKDALENNELQRAWDLAKAWYKQASSSTPKPSPQDFEMLYHEWTELYQAQPSPGDGIPVHVDPFDILDDPPDADEVANACRALHLRRACGASGMRTEDLQ